MVRMFSFILLAPAVWDALNAEPKKKKDWVLQQESLQSSLGDETCRQIAYCTVERVDRDVVRGEAEGCVAIQKRGT